MDRDTALALLKKYEIKDNVLKHSLAVNRFAVSLARKLMDRGNKIDLELVDSASLLHDIGRTTSSETKRHHSIEGCNILIKEGYPDIAEIVKKHGLGWIEKNKLETIEEKIVWYSDKRLDEDRVVSLNERLKLLETRHTGVAEFVEKIRTKIEEVEEEINKLLDSSAKSRGN